MPPPAITTSAVSMTLPAQNQRHAPHLEDQLERGKNRDVSIVERRRNLDYVDADYLGMVAGRAKQIKRISGRETCGRGNLGPGREGRVKRVDVERDVNLRAPNSLRNLLRRTCKVMRQVVSRH